jgi:acetyl esterase
MMQHDNENRMRQLRDMGPVIDPPAVTALYAPLIAQQVRDGVQCVNDLNYGMNERQKLDVYAPETMPPHGMPVVIFFHGGGFIRGDKSERAHVGYFLARNGILALVPSYRLAPEHPWPSGPQDVVLALQWAQTHAALHGGNPKRIILVGESAGAAHIAAAVLVKRFHPSQGLGVAGAMLISGVYNAQLEWLARKPFGTPSPDPRNEAYFGSDPANYPAMSTVALIDAPHLPLLITYAELDPIAQQVQASELFATLRTQHGAAPEIQMIRHHNHLSQIYAINTGDMILGQAMLDFVNCFQP